MKFLKIASSALAITMFLQACQSVDFKKTTAGVPYKLYPSKSGEKIAVGNVVKFDFSMKLKDSVLNTSYGKMPGFIDIQANPPKGYDVGPALLEILSNSKKGDSISISFVTDSLLNHNPAMAMQLPMKKGENLLFTVKILDVLKNKEAAQTEYMKEQQEFTKEQSVKDDQTIQSYLSSNHIAAQKKEHGTYVQVLQPGQGATVEPGKLVSVKYKGYTFAGKVFDTDMDNSKGHTDPLQFVVGQGQMIQGFDEGVTGLKEGAKVKLYIPSMMAYGPQPPSPDIKPFEDLIFDIEVLKVENAPVQPQQQMPFNMDSLKKK